MTTLERYLTTTELAERTGKTPDYWARLCNSKAIPAVKLGNDWRVASSVFEKFMRGGGNAALVARPERKTARQRRRTG